MIRTNKNITARLNLLQTCTATFHYFAPDSAYTIYMYSKSLQCIYKCKSQFQYRQCQEILSYIHFTGCFNYILYFFYLIFKYNSCNKIARVVAKKRGPTSNRFFNCFSDLYRLGGNNYEFISIRLLRLRQKIFRETFFISAIEIA